MTQQELKLKIISANDAYRIGSPIVDDFTYDSYLDAYRAYVSEPEYIAFLETLHEKSGKAKLPFIMGSLTKLKCSEPDTIEKFFNKHVKTNLHVSAKVDGISACLVYEGGKLIHAMTRGDGYNGEWLDDKIRYVKGVLETIPYLENIAIRGELVIFKDDFKSMSGTNPRNVCAGIMNRKRDSKEWNESDISKVTFVPYTILGTEYTKAMQFEILETCGFNTAWHTMFGCDYFKANNLDLTSELFKLATQDLPYEIDGVVISDSLYRNEDKYRPDAQMAVKTNTMSAETTLIDVVWEGPSKDGTHFPVGIIEPIELGGATISRVTLNNLDYIAELGLKYGCKVLVSKRGDIIPAIDEVISTPDGCRDIVLPDTCSCCGTALVRDGVNLRCMNITCRNQIIYQLEHFIKKLDVMNASFKTLDNFGIDSYDKLLTFNANKTRKNEVKFVNELVSKVFTRSADEIFCALNMRGLGETNLRKIIDFYGWDSIVSGNFDTTRMPVGIGQITLDTFMSSYKKNLDITLKFTHDIRYTGNTVKPVKSNAVSLKGSICFTGSLSIPRGDATKLAIAAGYEVKSSVTKGLTYLVTPDPNSGSSKNEKAKKYGTKVIDETEFMKLVDLNAGSISSL